MNAFLKIFHEYWLIILVLCSGLIGYWLKTIRLRNNPEYLQNLSEALVSETLLRELPNESWHLLNNITLEIEGGTTQIDHILVSRFGVFVIETKDYDGWVFGNKKSKKWMQITRFGKYPFQNPIHQNYRHIKAVQALLDFLPQEQVIGLIVFTDTAEFKTAKPDGVLFLDDLVLKLKTYDKELLSENRLQFCVGRIECKRLALTRETDIQHQANIQARIH